MNRRMDRRQKDRQAILSFNVIFAIVVKWDAHKDKNGRKTLSTIEIDFQKEMVKKTGTKSCLFF